MFPAETKSSHLENIKRRWTVIFKTAGLSNLSKHDLRHHYAIEALEAGIQPKVAWDLTEHSEEIITQRFYQVNSAKVARSAQAPAGQSLPRQGNVAADGR